MFAKLTPVFLFALTACAASSSPDEFDSPPASDPGSEEAIPAVSPPLSARIGLERVLEVLDAHRTPERPIACRSIRSSYVRSRGHGGAEVAVELDVTFFAEDDVAATARYTELRRALQACSWCLEVPDRPTRALEAGAGIYVEPLTVLVGDAVPEGWRLSAPEEGGEDDPPLEWYARRLARNASANLGQLDTLPRRSAVSRTVVDERLRLRPADRQATYTLRQVLNYFALLEDTSDHVVVTEIKLSPASKTRPHEREGERWVFEAEMSVRQLAEPNGRAAEPGEPVPLEVSRRPR